MLTRGQGNNGKALYALIGLTLAGFVLAACGSGDQSAQTGVVERASPDRDANMAREQLLALGGEADARTREIYAGEFQASGSLGEFGSDEGAWELRLLVDYGVFSRPGLGQDGGIPGERVYRAGGMQTTIGPVTVTLRNEQCPLPNGESLDFTAHVIFEGVVYQGCARRGVSDAARPTWASVLPELLPAIDACLERARARPARITTASMLDENTVSVRIREGDSTRRECIADADGATITAYETISDLDRRAGEGDPGFQRGAAAPTPSACESLEPATMPDGAAIGWLVRSTC